MSEPYISVITPVLNDCAGLKLTLATLPSGLPDGWEHIVVDGGSTDGSLKIAAAAQSQGQLRLISQKSAGLYGAFNDGLEIALGRHVIYLYCGDKLHVSRLKDLVDSIQLSEITILAASCTQPDSNGQLVEHLRSKRRPLCPQSHSILHSALLVRRQAYESVGCFDTSYRISGDVDAIVKIIKAGASIHYSDAVIVQMEKFSISQQHYWRKIREHYRIKRKNVGLAHALLYLVIRVPKDQCLLPFWRILLKTFGK